MKEKAKEEKEIVEEKEEKKQKSLTDIPGVGEATAEKLVEAGFNSFETIAVATPQELSAAVGIPNLAAQKIIIHARAALDIGFKTADVILDQRKLISRITTCSENLDQLLGGGIETSNITEMYGEFGSGKTQIAHELSVTVQLPPEKGGMEGKALYVDTEGSFRPERIVQMAEGLELDPKPILQNIIYARAYNTDHQMLIIEQAKEVIEKQNVKLIVVDSVTGHFRSEYTGREALAMRQQKLNRHLHAMTRISDIYNLAIFFTNQVMSRPDFFFGDPTTAVGGHVLFHTPGTRVYLRKGKAGRRIARLVDSSYLPEGEAVFEITSRGIRNPEEQE